jgi:hypothetical protein
MKMQDGNKKHDSFSLTKDTIPILPLTADFVEYINKHCTVDEEGTLKCRKCGSMVMIDFFEREIVCTECDEL